MKKIFVLLMAVMLLCGTAFAESGDWYLDIALEHAGKVGDLVKDEVYHQMMTSMESDCLEKLKDADFETMVSAHRCTLPNEAGMRVLMQAMTGWKLSDTALETQISTMPVVAISLYIGKLGMNELSVSTILTFQRTYIAPEDFVPCLYVLEMDGAAVVVAFSATGEDTITVSAQPLFGKDGGSIDDLIEEFAADSIPMEIEKVY